MEAMAYGDGTITRRKDGRLQVTVTIDGHRRYAMIAKGPPAEQRRAAEKRRRELLDLRDARG